jgi:predicted glycogen debranching enzyme
MISFGPDICSDLNSATSREWIITNGLGGYAAGTISGILTRRYHGLLITAVKPPVARTLMLTKLTETVTYSGQTVTLNTDRRWHNGEVTVTSDGYAHIQRFYLDDTSPVWEYAIGGAILEKRIWMQIGANTTYIRYTVLNANSPISLVIDALVNARDHHSSTKADAWQNAGDALEVTAIPNGLQILRQSSGAPLYLRTNAATVTADHCWSTGYFMSIEHDRGFADHTDDNFVAGHFSITLTPGQSVTIVASTDPTADLSGKSAWTARKAHEAALLQKAKDVKVLPQLVLAADQFIVQRPLTDSPDGKSVIAGYPWFSDWGRDTMISLPGLTLSTGRADITRQVLKTYSQFVDQGMLPNRFPDEGEAPEYNTADATLWYFEAIRAYYAATRDESLLRELFPILQDIIRWHLNGTRYNIRVDPRDGLLYAGGEGTQVTWMDVKIGNWVVTPRSGKPVEINALWYNALHTMAQIATILGENPTPYLDLLEKTKQGFQRFWNPARGYCFDVLDTPSGPNDATLRPNQLFAVSLYVSPLTPDQQRAVVDICTKELLTPYGLRSLGPRESAYSGQFKGDMRQRDSVYHQGTVWAWLIGPYVSAYWRVYRNLPKAAALLQPLIDHITVGCVGTISEIFDGDAPHQPEGCFAQAWSVAEVLRVWQQIHGQDSFG